MKLRLLYTRSNVSSPVISDIVLKTGVPINILEAKVSLNSGEMVVDVPATGKKLNDVRELFEKAGVSAKEIKSVIEIDYEKCISCGACVSPCPVQAIKQDPDWDVELDEGRCIRCLICVNACPVRAIRSP
jgi:NAD-dependent dihydropyrimidine dehydrogenase PreA subunit